ncbi:MAG: HAD-IIB family hydrolase [Bdellovibrionaceae bacterium]|jgi:HAD superfamily hydrolase (TIGR01484 family)|nr:HAD-IIB family hydrolase [Pseudobdellovibrionaceae bacterium]
MILPKPLNKLRNKSNVRIIFTDIDDTITTDGKLPANSYQALWQLHNRGYIIIPITGRPAGWCEMIARFWPVHGVIGENGGFYFRLHKNKMQREFFYSEATRKKNQKKLEKVKKEILKKYPKAQIASDQFSRLLDLAVDICEDVKPHLKKKEVKDIVSIFEKHGAIAKVSSIHINGWFGKYDKLTMCKKYVKNELKLNFDKNLETFLFSGDSPNDEPMFQAFPNSVGVANIKEFIMDLKHPPKFITEKEGADGFVEITKVLLA